MKIKIVKIKSCKNSRYDEEALKNASQMLIYFKFELGTYKFINKRNLSMFYDKYLL